MRTIGPRLGGEPVDVATLPTIVPAYPLTAPLLLPGTVVPLPALTPADRRLLEDVLAAPGDACGYLAVLQPREEPGDDEDETEPALYSVGCLAYLGETEEEGPQGLTALVEGVIRFRVVAELPPGPGGYRRLEVDFGDFLADPAAAAEGLDFSGLKDVVRRRVAVNRSQLDLSIMDGMVGTEIVTALAHAMPFSAAERQLLMETQDLHGLEAVLLELMATGPDGALGFDLPPLRPS